MDSAVQSLTSSGDVLFLMLGAVMVFAMHAALPFWKSVPFARRTRPTLWSRFSPTGRSRLSSTS